MWTRRKEEELPLKPAAQPPTSAELAREGIPISPLPARGSETEATRVATIGKSVIVKGQILSREDLCVDGEVEGSIDMQEHRLTVGPNGKVQAGIKAREVIVLGAVHGNIDTSDKIDIRKDAKLVGDIKTARVVIEDGAFFKGSIDVVRQEAARAPLPARPQPAPSTQAAAASVSPLLAGSLEPRK